jgi:hypothetical protein
MNYLATFLILAGCFAAMAIGLLIAKKVLKKGCGIDPDDCLCKKEGKDPSQCDR